MLRRRFLVPFAALLAMAAAAPVLLGGGSHAQEADVVAFENPAPSASAELRVWQSVRQPLRLWLSARPDADASWTTSELNLAMREGGGWRIADQTVDSPGGELDVRVWQHPSALSRIYLSARPASASWNEYGTQRVELDQTSRSGRYRYGDVAVALAWPDAPPSDPGSDPIDLDIPDDLDTETLNARIWRSVAPPHRYWISTRPDADSSWRTRPVTLTATGEDGWSAGALTADAGAADFELRLWAKGNAHALSARVAGATWDEYGTQSVTLNRTSASGNYTYANLTITLTLPEAEPPDPGEDRTWLASGTGGGTGTGETGGTGEAEPTPTPDPDNRAPWADAGDDQTVAVGDTVTLDGSGSADIDEDDITYAWRQTGGTYTGAVTLTGAATASPTFTVDAALSGQTVEFTLTVTDEHGLSRTDTVTITVLQQQQGGGAPPPGGQLPVGVQPPTNTAPTAEAGADQTVAEGATVTLDGSGSSDSDGTISSYAWEKTDGTYDGTSTISIGSMASPSFLMPDDADAGETLIITLTVTDDDGATGTDTVTITVAADTLALNAGSDADVQRGATATLTGAYTDPDPASTPTYKWTQAGGTYTGATSITNSTSLADATFTVPLAAAADATIIVRLTVTDDGKDYSDTVTITAKNTAPTGADAGTAQSVDRGSPVTLSAATATDANGDSLTYSWEHTGGTYKTRTGKTVTITGATSATFTMPTDANVDETIIATLTVSDGYGGSDTDTVTITATNATPTANASATGTTRGETVTLDGSASSDPDGTLSYSWAKSATSTCTETVTLSDTTAQKPTFTLPTACADASTLIFTLTVTDNDNATDTDDATVTVGNVPPTVDAGSNVNATAGVAVQLNATATDPDGSTFTWSWSAAPSTANDQFSDRTIANPTFTPKADDAINTVYTLLAVATDGDGGKGEDMLIVKVGTANSGPSSAEAGSAQTVNQGATVSLSGSGSDPEGDTLTYSWAKTGGTYSGSISLTNANTATPSFTAPNLTGLTSSSQSRTIILTLTVSDAQSRTATDTVTITVQNAKPTVSISNANVTASNSYKPSATVNDPDGDNTKLTYAWSLQGASGMAQATVANANTASPTIGIPWNAALNGTYTLSVTVTDEDGAASTQASATLTVNNRAPTATAKGTSYGQPSAKIYLIGQESTDPDGDTTNAGTLTCTWEKAGGAYDGTAGYTFLYADSCTSTRFTMPSDATAGETIIVRLTVTDSKGGTSTDGWTVSVGSAPPPSNTAPDANAGADQVFRMGQNNDKVTVNASGSSDPEGGALDYTWRVTGTYASLVTLQSSPSTPHIVSFTWPSQSGLGTGFNVIVTVCDPHNLCDSDTMIVTRKYGLTVSIDTTPSGRTCTNRTPETVTFTGTISNPDGFPTVTWGDWTVVHDDNTATEPATGVSVVSESGNSYQIRFNGTATPPAASLGTYTIAARVTGSGLQKFDSGASGRITFTLKSSSESCP